jgi:hypothetical protein
MQDHTSVSRERKGKVVWGCLAGPTWQCQCRNASDARALLMLPGRPIRQRPPAAGVQCVRWRREWLATPTLGFGPSGQPPFFPFFLL